MKFTVLEVLKKVHPRGANTFRAVTDDRHARPADRGVQASRAGALHADGAVGLRVADAAEAHLRHGDIANHPRPTRRSAPGRSSSSSGSAGQFIRLDRNPDYWKQGRPYLDRIVARFIADGGTRTAAMEKGEAHIGGFDAIRRSTSSACRRCRTSR